MASIRSQMDPLKLQLRQKKQTNKTPHSLTDSRSPRAGLGRTRRTAPWRRGYHPRTGTTRRRVMCVPRRVQRAREAARDVASSGTAKIRLAVLTLLFSTIKGCGHNFSKTMSDAVFKSVVGGSLKLKGEGVTKKCVVALCACHTHITSGRRSTARRSQRKGLRKLYVFVRLRSRRKSSK